MLLQISLFGKSLPGYGKSNFVLILAQNYYFLFPTVLFVLDTSDTEMLS